MFCLSGWIPPEKLQGEIIKARESVLLRKQHRASPNWINHWLNIVISWKCVETLCHTTQMLLLLFPALIHFSKIILTHAYFDQIHTFHSSSSDSPPPTCLKKMRWNASWASCSDKYSSFAFYRRLGVVRNIGWLELSSKIQNSFTTIFPCMCVIHFGHNCPVVLYNSYNTLKRYTTIKSNSISLYESTSWLEKMICTS